MTQISTRFAATSSGTFMSMFMMLIVRENKIRPYIMLHIAVPVSDKVLEVFFH